MGIEVRVLRNPELIRSIILESWDYQAEDGMKEEDYQPAMGVAGVHWLGLLKDGEVVGVVLVQPMTATVAFGHIAYRRAQFGKREENVAMAKAALEWIWKNTKYDKLQAITASPVVVAFDQRIGFKREGVLRKSWRKNGELLDQTILGLSRP